MHRGQLGSCQNSWRHKGLCSGAHEGCSVGACIRAAQYSFIHAMWIRLLPVVKDLSQVCDMLQGRAATTRHRGLQSFWAPPGGSAPWAPARLDGECRDSDVRLLALPPVG